jgi:F0F1-type ATP synthase membrane subunit b/b'
MFFKPLERVLKNRYEATEGARQRAAKSMELAAAKTTEYENAMRAARGEVYQAHDRLHKKLQEEQAAAVREARAKVEAKVNEVKNQLAADVERTKGDLLPESDRLAAQIADAVLRRSAA